MHSKSSRNKLDSISPDGRSEARSLPLEELRKITNDFSDKRLIGEGGFGKVYKGLLQNGDMIAVKKLTSSMPGVHDRQFENEVHHLMRLQHPNIVQLVGYCSDTENILVQHDGRYVYAEKSERLLCLEYMPNGSLHEHLSGESSGLDWYTRYRIIEGVCSGLHYLHEEWQVNTPIIHMDLKPANILLDANMVPKIADFGLSRLFGAEKTRTCTRSREGTLGYMAPEYINKGLITKKLDIFSLGVIIIQIITGHKDYPDESETSHEFIELAIKNWRNRLEKIPGYTSFETDCQQIRRCFEIGLLCVKLNRAKRPTTRQIIEMLHRPGEVIRKPAKEVLTLLPHTPSKAVGTPYRSLEGNGQPKRKLLETNLNRVETNWLETPAQKDFLDLGLWPRAEQDTDVKTPNKTLIPLTTRNEDHKALPPLMLDRKTFEFTMDDFMYGYNTDDNYSYLITVGGQASVSLLGEGRGIRSAAAASKRVAPAGTDAAFPAIRTSRLTKPLATGSKRTLDFIDMGIEFDAKRPHI